MTLAPHRPTVAFTSLEDAVSILRHAGCRISAARRVLLEALFAADGPVSAEHLAAGLDGRVVSSDLTSVYRNLERLEELGVVRHVHLGHGPGLYALAGVDREYLVCERCHEVRTVSRRDLDVIRDHVRKRFGYEARFSHFPIAGLCARCAREFPTTSGPQSKPGQARPGQQEAWRARARERPRTPPGALCGPQVRRRRRRRPYRSPPPRQIPA